METAEHQFNAWICTSLGDTDAPSPKAFVMKPPMWTLDTVPPPKAPAMGANRLRRPSSSMAGLKPGADRIRNVLPFGLPKREGQRERTSRNIGGVASSQVDPHQGGIGARAQRHGRGRDRPPLRLPGRMDGPAPLAFVRPPDAPREVRLNEFPGALAEVPRNRFGGDGCRVSGAAPTGVFGTSKGDEPAYPVPLLYASR